MNIFFLSSNVKRCASYHCDKHVVKMILEYAQLLCTCHLLLDELNPSEHPWLYKATHKNHPCSIWVRSSSENYKWLYGLFCELCDEYTHRYGKIHKTDTRLRSVLATLPNEIPQRDSFTNLPCCMPDSCKFSTSTIENYREYYRIEKKHFCKWTKREIPKWFY